MQERLTENNFLLYCAKKYDNPQAFSTEEFLEDLERIKYIKKLITRYLDNGEIRERLILNHIITLKNCFGLELAKILFLKLEDQFKYVKPFLLYLSILPDKIYNVGDRNVVIMDDVPMEQAFINSLRKFNNESKNY